MTPDYAAEAEELKKLDDQQLAEIGKLAARLVKTQKRIARTEAVLKARKEQEAKLSKEVIPERLSIFGLEKVTLRSGHEIEVKRFYSANISEERRKAAHAWLREHGFGSLIKNEISIPIPAGEDKEAELIKELLTKEGVSFTTAESVHASTLKSFVKTQLEAPEEEKADKPPTELFGIFQGNIATVKNKKGK